MLDTMVEHMNSECIVSYRWNSVTSLLKVTDDIGKPFCDVGIRNGETIHHHCPCKLLYAIKSSKMTKL